MERLSIDLDGDEINPSPRILAEEKKKEEEVLPPLERSTPPDSDHENPFTKFAFLIQAEKRPLPTQAGDVQKTASTGIWDDLKSLSPENLRTIKDLAEFKSNGGLVDDKAYLMERTIRLAAALPAESKRRAQLSNDFVDSLWSTLPHPPQTYLGDKYAFRSADGSGNNVLYPQLGAANTAYARSVKPMTMMPASLPDPGLIFDAVLSRKTFRKHPNNISSVLFYWASLLIHDIFQTNHSDFTINGTSSYLDLSILYGDCENDQKKIRTYKDGYLKPDCFSEKRIVPLPPGMGVILIMFNRYHNYVVEQLAIINENGRFTKPNPARLPADKLKAAWEKYDNDLFQTGRLVTCGLYMSITLSDYVHTLINVNRSNTTWTLDPRVDMGQHGTPRGTGNQVSVEFNGAYRWHSCISEKDEQWTEDIYKKIFGKPASEVPMPELLRGLGEWSAALSDDPTEWPFADLKRGADGRFNDDDLVNILSDSIEDVAGSFGANHIPKSLRAVEILGIMQCRKWGLASLNEFRNFCGLKSHETFESINSDPEVANQLKHLYDHPDFVELYPGIMAEEAKAPMVPAVGISTPFTISRAILSDAVTLIRSDRFYTTDYNAKNLTNWGFNEAQSDPNVGKGCVFYKLCLRAFPNHFKPNSIYAHEPMTIPSENRRIMQSLGRESHYSYDRPAPIPSHVNLSSYLGAKYVLGNQHLFKVTWGATVAELMGKEGGNFMLSGDTAHQDNWQRDVKAFYEATTLRLLHEKSFKIAGINHVDITRDIGNLAHVHFASDMFSLPLKTTENASGVLTEHEMYMAVVVLFVCAFSDSEPTKSFPLHLAARSVAKKLGTLIETNVKSVGGTSWISGFMYNFRPNHNALKEYGIQMIRRLLNSGLSAEQVAWSQILPTAAAMVPNQAQAFTQIIDYYLSPVGKKHLPEINRIAKEDSEESDRKLLHYAMEAIRLNGTSGSYRLAAGPATIIDGDRTVEIKTGDKVFVSFVKAARDPTVFPHPEEVRLDRPIDSYIHYGDGPHTCIGRDVSQVAVTAMLKVVGRLDNLRRAPGPKGELKKIPRPGGFYSYMREQHEAYFPFPTTMQINWDGELAPLPK